MIKGKIYFFDGHEEDILDYRTDNGLIKAHTSNGDYVYKPLHNSVIDWLMSIMPDRRYYDVVNWTQPIFYKRVQEFQEDGNVKDKLVKVPITAVKLFTLSEMGIKKESYLRNLTSIMTVKGITLDELSYRSGFNKQRLEKYINGEVKPREATVIVLAAVLDVPAYSLSDKSYIGKEMEILKHLERKNNKENTDKCKLAVQNFERYIREKFYTD